MPAFAASIKGATANGLPRIGRAGAINWRSTKAVEVSDGNGTTLRQIERNDDPTRAVIPVQTLRLSFS